MVEEIEKLAAVFKALSDPTRLQILKILEAGDRSVTEIVDYFSLSQPTISRHLAALKASGLIKSKKQEQQKIYSLDTEALKSFLREYFGSFENLKGYKL
ncbi:MAG TPA: ArsR family transcriptional regulator [candidate division Zixibacteria bacterium]|nr:ArsR family transcriptional regulator [candidate division Zixibacteria bacterium]HEQ98150.1 ArsR family transcriptional regulator [candidate division Zixibacteria bacterium]